MTLHRSLRNLILPQISTPRTPCVTLSLRNAGRRGSARRRRSPGSTRVKRLRRNEHGRNAKGKRRQRRSCRCRESRTQCAMWRSCSNLWEFQKGTTKEGPHGGVEAGVLHRLRENASGQGAVGHPNHILLARAGEVQADPGPRGGGKKSHGFSG